MQQEATPILNVSHLSKTFPIKRNIAEIARKKEQKYVRAVEDVTFSIRKGETLGLVGESGCGKSTLSKTLIRLYKPDDGKIMFDQYGDLALKEGAALTKARRDIQMVYQDPYSSLNPKMTIRQMFYEILSVHHICPKEEFEKKTIEILDMVGMPSYALDRYPSAFSGGQRQRIGIARALILNPALLIADEPVSALDMSIQAQIINLLMDLKAKLNLTMLFISHDLRVVQYLSDRVMVMYLGRVVEMGSAEELFQHPAHPYTQILIQAAPVIDTKHKEREYEIRGETPSPIDIPKGCAFHPRCPFATEKCRTAEPVMTEDANGRMVKCHYPLVDGFSMKAVQIP
ncbi:ABC transporter ATP-binding protein [Clostridiaceae bacterium Marseille-Q4145]|nr:ABC transporter ATP-binding protein [Clostridiaceae bacterium Marseille-Q4145]